MLTRGFSPVPLGQRGRAGTWRRPYCCHSQNMARFAHCHWSSSMVRGKKRCRLVPSGVTPPPIISAMDPVTTTAGRSGSSAAWARRIAPSVPSRPSCSSARPVTTIGSSCGGRASVQCSTDVTGRFSQPTGPSMIDLQALDGGEYIHRSPVASCAIVVKHQHVRPSPPLCVFSAASPAGAWFRL